MRTTQINSFTGGMDADSDPRVIQPGDYIYATNLLNGSNSLPGSMVTVKGNVQQSYTLPSGSNICIGAIEDKIYGSLVYFVWNQNENHRILRWWQQSGRIDEIAGGLKLNFDRYSRVQGTIVDGRLMYWTEAKTNGDAITGNEPRAIDLDMANNYEKLFQYELFFDVQDETVFANGTTYTITETSITGNVDPVQVVFTADGSFEGDVEGGLEWLYDEIVASDLDDVIDVELCDCKLTITTKTAGRMVTFSSSASNSRLALINAYGHQISDFETYHYALKREPPSSAPYPECVALQNVGYNNVRDGGFQFRSRYVYHDGTASHWSAVSNMPLNNAQFGDPQDSLNGIRVYFEDDRLDDVKWLSIIRYVEVAFRYDQNDVFKLIQRIPICEAGVNNHYIEFANDNLYSVIPSDDVSTTSDTQVLTNYHRVPYRAGAISPIAGRDGNLRLAFGAVQEGQTCPTCVAGSVDPVVFEDENLVDISGTVEIINDPDASVTDISFPQYVLGGFVVYLAGTPYYAVSDNPADGTGTGRFTIKNVPRGQYVLRVASYACRYNDDLGPQYNLLNGIEWQKTSSPVIDCAGSVAETGNEYERILDLYGFVGTEYDLDVVSGFGTIQIQNYHQCPKTTSGSLFLNEVQCLDADGLYSTFEERKSGATVETLSIDFYQGNSDLANLTKSTRADHNGYAWILADTTDGTRLRPVIQSWGGDNTNAAQPYHVFASALGGWKAITNEDFPPEDLNDDETGYDINDMGVSQLQGNIDMAFIFNNDPDWTAARRGQVRGKCVDSAGNGIPGVLIWMAMNGRTTTTNSFGEYALTVYQYDLFGDRIALQELHVTYLPDSAGSFQPTPLFDSTVFEIPNESPFQVPDFEFGFLGGIEFSRRFLKSGGRYKIGVVYEDDGGKSPCGVTPLDTVLIPFHTQDGEYSPRQLQWTINSRPPAWATRFKIVRTKDSFYQTYKHLPVGDVKYVSIPENATAVTEVTYGSGTATHIMLNIRTQVPDDPNALPSLFMFRDNIQLGYKSKFGDRCRYLLDESQQTVFTDSLLEVSVDGEYIDGVNYWVIIPYTDIQREILPGWVFEFFTPKGFEEEIYYETGSTYELLTAPLRHSGDIQDQNLGLFAQPAIGYVDSGDTYWRLQQFEVGDDSGLLFIGENETKNKFVDKKVEDIGRPFAVDLGGNDQFYPNRIRFSGLYVPSSNINDLNAYGGLDFQSLNRTFGAIKWLGMVNTVLLSICQNKVQPIYVGKARVLDTSGVGLVGRADEILAIADETVADAGTMNPESVAVHDGRAYWWDIQRGSVWRYGPDGVQPMVKGKIRYFRDKHDERINLDRNTDICPGGIDRRHNLYYLTFGLEYYLGPEDELIPVERDTLSLDLEKMRWVTHWGYGAETHVSVYDDFLQANNGGLWLAYKNDTRSLFFGTSAIPQVQYAANAAPLTMKDWHCLRLQADKKWWANSIELLPTASWPNGMFSRLKATKMVLREGQWWGDFMRDMTDPHAEFVAIGDADLRLSTALLRGRFLKGDCMLVTIQPNDETTDNILFSSAVDYSDSQNTK